MRLTFIEPLDGQGDFPREQDLNKNLVAHSVAVLILNAGEWVVNDGLPSDLAESAVEGAVGVISIAAEFNLALDQLW